MNIYDFDGTIYNGDSCRDIVIYGLKKYPKKTFASLKKARELNKDYKSGLINFEQVKEAMLSFIFEIENYPKFVNDFVNSHMKKIKPWYLSRKNENDMIITASCDLWINLFASRLGLKHIIATKIDSNGRIIGNNCKGIEKVNRFKQLYSQANVVSAYGDSENDIPMLELAHNAFVVEGNRVITYRRGYRFKKKK